MPVRIELNLRLPNSPGALAEVCRLLADERVNVEAFSLDDGGALRLVVDNHVRALAALRSARHRITEREVVVVPVAHAPGGAASAARLMADAGINIEYAYSGAVPGVSSTVVMGVLGRADVAASAAGV